MFSDIQWHFIPLILLPTKQPTKQIKNNKTTPNLLFPHYISILDLFMIVTATVEK